MARRRQPPAPVIGRETPPAELLRCPWERFDDWDRSRFESWLTSRQAWRSNHAEPLPALLPRDRYALHTLDGLSPQIVAAEVGAPVAEPSWRDAAAAATGRRRGA